jgi:hypothetical protein
MTTVYLAGASADLEQCEMWMGRLLDAGLTIAYNWPANVRRVGDANPREASHDSRLRWSVDAHIALVNADVSWFLIPTSPSIGCWVEFGQVSVRRGGHDLIVSGDWRSSIFTSLADHRFDAHGQAFDWIAKEYA